MSEALNWLEYKIKILEISKEYASCKACVQKDIDDLVMVKNRLEKLEKSIELLGKYGYLPKLSHYDPDVYTIEDNVDTWHINKANYDVFKGVLPEND